MSTQPLFYIWKICQAVTFRKKHILYFPKKKQGLSTSTPSLHQKALIRNAQRMHFTKITKIIVAVVVVDSQSVVDYATHQKRAHRVIHPKCIECNVRINEAVLFVGLPLFLISICFIFSVNMTMLFGSYFRTTMTTFAWIVEILISLNIYLFFSLFGSKDVIAFLGFFSNNFCFLIFVIEPVKKELKCMFIFFWVWSVGKICWQFDVVVIWRF